MKFWKELPVHLRWGPVRVQRFILEETRESVINLNVSQNIETVIDFLNEVSGCFRGCYENVRNIKCNKKRMTQLERNFISLSTIKLVIDGKVVYSLLRICGVETTFTIHPRSHSPTFLELFSVVRVEQFE